MGCAAEGGLRGGVAERARGPSPPRPARDGMISAVYTAGGGAGRRRPVGEAAVRACVGGPGRVGLSLTGAGEGGREPQALS